MHRVHLDDPRQPIREVMNEGLGVRAGRFITDNDLIATKPVLACRNEAPELIEPFPRVAELEDPYVSPIYRGAIPGVVRHTDVDRRDQRAFLYGLYPLR